ncbi:MAG TPA: ATP-binding cassette domain-containing protein [Aquihabitans sp.]|nr:ATP-binding cassette domain-containing protein [Aquihabitans sp.]
MIELLSLVVAGAVSGGLYAVMASGLVLTYQASGIFNLGHGAIAFTTAITYYVLHQPDAAGGLGLPIVPAALISVGVVAPLLGILLDVALFRRLASAPEAARLVGSIGVLIALPAAALLLIEVLNLVFDAGLPAIGGDSGVAPPGIGPTPPESYTITRGVAVSSDQLAVLLAAALTAGGLWFLLRRTRLGLETRAGVDRASLAGLRGIDTDRSSRIVWGLTSMLAGLAGVLIAPLFDLSAITFHMIVFTSFTAAVAARLRSVPIAFVAGLALGVIQNLVAGYAPDVLDDISGFRSSVPFILLFVLMFFVQGRGRAAGTVAEDAPAADPRSDLPPWRRRLPWGIATALFLAYGLLVADSYWSGVMHRGLVLSLIFLSFVVVTGLGGMINLAQAAFVTTGGFVAGWAVNHQFPSTVPILMSNGRLVFWLAALAAVVAAAAVGVLVALPSLRLGGLSLALATLALAFVGDRLIFQLEGVRNGSRGWSVPRPAYGPVDLGDDRTLLVVLVALVGLVVWLVSNLQRSASGRAVLALRSSSVAATTAGVDPVRTKLTLFAVSAALAGFGGAFYAMVNSPITNTSAPPLLGVVWLAVAVTFGIRRPGGAVVAGLVYSIFPVVLSGIGGNWTGAPWSALPDTARELLGEPELASLLFGLGAVGLAREPDGVLAHVGHALRERRQARAGRRGAEQAEVQAAVSAASTEVHGGTVATADEPAAAAAVPAAVPDEPLAGPPEPPTPGSVPARPRAAEGDLPSGDVPAGDGVPARAPADDRAAALQLVDVRAGYGEVEVLHGVDLSVPAGGVVAVLGANGAGKSTLCGVAGGLVEATGGRVLLAGQDVTDAPPHVRARAGLLLAPEARGVFPGLSVEDNLAIRLRTPAARRAAHERFPILADRRTQLAGLLSGGEQQQLALAVALGDPPAVFLADEPSLGLAPMATETVFEALAELRDLGSALVLVEEQAGGALALADTVVLMELGRVAWSGLAGSVDRARLTASYLGAPAPV